MRLTSELTVAAPLERAWPALLELGGPLSVDLGVAYAGVARLDDADDDEHAAGFHVLGREQGGNGLASATIVARAAPEGDVTRIAVDTELKLSGAAVQPGQEEAQAAADRLLAQLAAWLERPATAAQPDPPAVPVPSEHEPLAVKGPDALVLAGKVAERALLVVAGIALGLAIGHAVWRRR